MLRTSVPSARRAVRAALAEMLVAIIVVAACSGASPAVVMRTERAQPTVVTPQLPARSTPFSLAPQDRPVRDLSDAFAAAVVFLGPHVIPGDTVDGIDSISYVRTTVRGADEALGAPSRVASGAPAINGDTPAWLFVEYAQYGLVSEHGSHHGDQGTEWVLAPEGFKVEHGSFSGRIDLAALGSPTVIAEGQLPALDALRNPTTALVQTSANAIGAVARTLGNTAAVVSSITYTETDARTAAALTGISAAGLPAGTKAWAFNVDGVFSLFCGGDFRDTASTLRLLVVAGTSSAYVLGTGSVSASATPTPVALSEFGPPRTIDPGAWPALDNFRGSNDAIRATATSWAGGESPPDCSDARP